MSHSLPRGYHLLLAVAVATGCGRIGFEGVPAPDASAPTDGGDERPLPLDAALDAAPEAAVDGSTDGEAGVQPDGETEPQCRNDAECDDADPRTRDICRTGRCVHERRVCPASPFRSVAAGARHSCGIDETGGLWCWGDNTSGQLGTGDLRSRPWPLRLDGGMGDAVTLDLGGSHSCAVDEAGRLWCWGNNTYGQLGLGDTERRLVPSHVASLPRPVRAVGLGQRFSYAVDATGELWCWGNGGNGRLGTASTNVHQTTPVPFADLANVTMVTAGNGHVCAIDESGGLWCWGRNRHGELGLGTSGLGGSNPTPERLTDILHPRDVAAGAVHGCAVDGMGGLWCWGNNTFGQLGLGDQGPDTNRSRPELLSSLSLGGVWVVAAGNAHTCAIDGMGSLWCWGSNSHGQLGLGHTELRDTPQRVEGLVGVRSVALGDAHTCAVDEAGRLWCWGNNTYGQLGLGDLMQRTSPTLVAEVLCAPAP